MFGEASVGYGCNGYEDADDDYDDEELDDGETRGVGGVRGAGRVMTGFGGGIAIAVGVVVWFGYCTN